MKLNLDNEVFDTIVVAVLKIYINMLKKEVGAMEKALNLPNKAMERALQKSRLYLTALETAYDYFGGNVK